MKKNIPFRPVSQVGLIVILIGMMMVRVIAINTTLKSTVLAQSIAPSQQIDENAPSLSDQNGTTEQQRGSDNDLATMQAQKRLQFMENLKRQLETAQRDYSSISSSRHQTENKLGDLQEERLTLQDQLQNLDSQIADTTALLQNVIMQIDEKENQLQVLAQDIQIRTVEISNQKRMLSEYLNVLYQQENGITNTTDTEKEINVAKMLLSDKSPAETLQELRYFTVLEDTGHKIFDRLEALIQEQQTQQSKLELTKQNLTSLYSSLALEKKNLDIQRQAKVDLLQQTSGQELIYQQLVAESKLQEDQSLSDIQQLRENLAFIQTKINELGDKFNPDNFKGIISRETTNVYQFIRDTKDQTDFAPKWPVSPTRGISAYFHDESYRRAMGVPHEAIDIPVPQGSPIHAPADGVVFKTKDNGFGYSYIILAHAGGFMTVYGHVSEIRVTEGQKIASGETIGLSGAMPGTKGAGLMTTGPHLHFEVLKGGKHVDPLDYLELSYLPLNNLADKYLKRVTGDQAKVRRELEVNNEAEARSTQQILDAVEANGKYEETLHSNTP